MTRNRLLAWLLFATVAGYWIAQAGSLEPPGAPSPTMRDLDTLSGSWKEYVTPVLRFELVFHDQAVLDRETGLVWERVPSTGTRTWYDSINHCLDRVVDNHKGWRLPVAEELFSLIDPSRTAPALPLDHPFTPASGGAGDGPNYWTMTAYADGYSNPAPNALSVDLGTGDRYPQAKTWDYYAWCVRGGSGYDAGHG